MSNTDAASAAAAQPARNIVGEFAPDIATEAPLYFAYMAGVMAVGAEKCNDIDAPNAVRLCLEWVAADLGRARRYLAAEKDQA